MNPRLRILFFALALLLFAIPAQAARADVPCVPDSGLPATFGTDTTNPSSAWQTGSPAGTLSIPLTGTSVDGFEWMINCGPTLSGNPGDSATITAQGRIRFTHRARETGTGLWTGWVDNWVQIDSEAPTNTTTPPLGWVRGPLNVAITGTDTSPIAATEWRDGPSGAFTSGPTATVAGTTGDHELHTAVTDSVGIRTEKTSIVKVDNTLPVDGTVVPVGWQHQVTDVTIAGSDVHSGVDHVEWELDGSPGSGAPGTVLHIGHGDHVLKTRVIDNVGNDTGWTTRSVQVDINGPIDTTTVPAGWVTTGTEVPVSVSGTDTGGRGVVRVEWKLTDVLSGDVLTGDVAGAGPVPITVSGDGRHKLETRLTDGFGDTSGWKTQYVKIDTVMPTDTTNPVSGWLKTANLNVTVGGTDLHSDVEHVEWKLNGTPGSAVGRSQIVPVTREGLNTLETRVFDNAGNVSGWTTHTVRLDTTAPLNLTPAAPSGWQKTPYAVTLSGDDAGSGVSMMRWRVDNGSVYEGTSGAGQAKVLATGTYTLYTWAVDNVGNLSAERPETVKVDLVTPTDATVYPSVAVPKGRKITFAPSDADSGVAATEWKLDGGAVKTTPSVTLVGGGSHTLETRVTDNAGNTTGWVSHSITVNLALPPEDTDAPVDTTAVPPEWQTGPYTVIVSATDDDGTGVNTVAWKYDGRAIESGPSGSAVPVTTDGVHEFETRAIDNAGNRSEWKPQTLKIDHVPPADTTALPAGWSKSRAFTMSGTDATSGVATMQYKINGGPTLLAASGATVTLPADGDYTIAHRALDNAGQDSGWKYDSYKVDTVLPSNTSAAAPTGWQTAAALSLALTGTDALSGVDHGEWRVGGVTGEVHAGATAEVATEGTQTLETRIVDAAGNASAWRSETVKIDHTAPTNTTPLPASPWRNTNYAVTVSGSDAASGVLRIEYKLDNGTVVTTPAVTISTAGSHKLESRVLDVAGNVSAWRTDTIGIDKTVPTLAVDCGTAAWRSSPATCTVSAGGGESGLPTLTAARGTGAADAVTGGSYTVDADGAATINFRAVDGAGNETLAHADVKIDRASPAAALTCAEGGATSYVCTGSGSDDLSGLAGLTYSVDGSPATPVNGTFAVQKGTVVVTAVDAAGNTASSAPVALADRTPPPAPPAPAPPKLAPTPRTSSEAVLLRGNGSPSARLLGQLSMSGTPTRTTVDLRPLALGKGKFQFTFKVKVDKKTTTVRKTQATKSGYSQRISVRAAAGADAQVALTVRRYSAGRWVAHATGSAQLG